MKTFHLRAYVCASHSYVINKYMTLEQWALAGLGIRTCGPTDLRFFIINPNVFYKEMCVNMPTFYAQFVLFINYLHDLFIS